MFDVVTYFDRHGNDEIQRFLDELDAKSASGNKNARINYEKIREYIATLKQYGTAIGMPEIRKIKGSKENLWELRPLKNRIFFMAWQGNKFVLLHHFQKKTGKTPQEEIKRAENKLQDWKERFGE